MNIEALPAYRIPISTDLFDLTEKIRKKAQKVIVEVGKEFYSTLMSKNKKLTPYDCMRFVADKIDDMPIIDIVSATTAKIIIRKFDTHYYFIPDCSFLGMKHILDFLNTLDGMENFSYSSSVGRPSAYTEDQWVFRKTIWEKIYSNLDNSFLTIEICDYITWFDKLDPWLDMMKESLLNMSFEEKKKYLSGFANINK